MLRIMATCNPFCESVSGFEQASTHFAAEVPSDNAPLYVIAKMTERIYKAWWGERARLGNELNIKPIVVQKVINLYPKPGDCRSSAISLASGTRDISLMFDANLNQMFSEQKIKGYEAFLGSPEES